MAVGTMTLPPTYIANVAVWTAGNRSRTISIEKVIKVSGCPKCGLFEMRIASRERMFAELLAAAIKPLISGIPFDIQSSVAC